jgi:hypothetical protein
LVKDGFSLVLQACICVHIVPLFHQQQLSPALLALSSSGQCVAWDKHFRPWGSGCDTFSGSKSAMNADNVDSRAFERAVREVLNATEALEARDAAANDSDVRAIQADRELEMICDVT